LTDRQTDRLALLSRLLCYALVISFCAYMMHDESREAYSTFMISY